MDKKRATKALDFEAVPKRAQAPTDGGRSKQDPATTGQTFRANPSVPGPYDPTLGTQAAGNPYMPPHPNSRAAVAFMIPPAPEDQPSARTNGHPPPAPPQGTNGPVISNRLQQSRPSSGAGGQLTLSGAGGSGGGRTMGRTSSYGPGQRAPLTLTAAKSSTISQAQPPGRPPASSASGPLGKPRGGGMSGPPQQKYPPPPSQSQQQHHPPSGQPRPPASASAPRPGPPPVYQPRTSTSPRTDASPTSSVPPPNRSVPGGPQTYQPNPVESGAPPRPPHPTASAPPVYVPKASPGSVAHAPPTQQAPSPPPAAAPPLLPPPSVSRDVSSTAVPATNCPEYRPGVPPSTLNQRSSVSPSYGGIPSQGLGQSRMGGSGGGGGGGGGGRGNAISSSQPLKGPIKPLGGGGVASYQPRTPDTTMGFGPQDPGGRAAGGSMVGGGAAAPAGTGRPSPSSGDVVALQQEVERLRAEKLQAEEKSGKAEQEVRSLKDALSEKADQALELGISLATEEAERNKFIAEIETLKRQLRFKEQELLSADVVCSRAQQQEAARRKRKSPGGSVVGEGDDNCSRTSATSSPDSKAKPMPQEDVSSKAPPPSAAPPSSSAPSSSVPLPSGIPPPRLSDRQFTAVLREFSDHLCCLLSSAVPVISGPSGSRGEAQSSDDAFLLRLASTLRPPPSLRRGDKKTPAAPTSEELRRAETIRASLASQLYQAVLLAAESESDSHHSTTVLQALTCYLDHPEIVGSRRLLSAVRVARCLLSISPECRAFVVQQACADNPPPLPPPAPSSDSFSSRYRGGALPPAKRPRIEGDAGAAVTDANRLLPLRAVGGFFGALSTLLTRLVKDDPETAAGSEAVETIDETLGILLTLAHEIPQGRSNFWDPLLQAGSLQEVLVRALRARQVDVVSVWIEILQCLVQHQDLFHQIRVLRQGSFFSDVSHQVLQWHVDKRWDGPTRVLVDRLTLRVLRLLTGMCVKYGVTGRELIWSRGRGAEQQTSAIRLIPSLIHVLNQEVMLFTSSEAAASRANDDERVTHLTLVRETFVLFSLLGTQQEKDQTDMLKDIILRTNVKWTLAAINFRLMNNMVDPSLNDLSEEAEYWAEALEG